jgi:heme/copper-type cytochrome/quinol oxidase subunit 3
MSSNPASLQTRAADAATILERQRRAQPSGWWGALLLIASEAALFGCLIATYFYLRFKVSAWPPDAIPKPSVTAPLALTAMLVASCLPVFYSVRAARDGLARRAWWLLLLATAVQGTYLGLQIHLFVDDLHSFAPQVDAYASAYYAIVGLHHVHVALGLAFDLWLLARLLGGLTDYRLVAIRILGVYWYFVSAVGILVVLTQLYPSL